MKRMAPLLLFALALVWTLPADAQLLFWRRPKVNPTQRVPELILTVKTDADDRKRTHAAEELRDYDAKTFTEIVPVLVDVLLNDKKVNVRTEALNSLAKIRPVSTLAGQAMERAAALDESPRLRSQAKSALVKYYQAGYSSGKNEPAVTPTVQKKTPEGPPVLPSIPKINDSSFSRRLPPGPPEKDQGPSLFP